jgi:peptidoglycan/LPS O-acetylase OafA/YrhL
MIYHKSLDSIRALAVISVLIGHWFVPFNAGKGTDLYFWIKGLIPSAAFGVHLFFVLSGFLITNILLEARFNSNNSTGVIIKNFIIRRVLRIFPIYYLSIILLYLAGFPFKDGTLAYILLYITNIKFYQDISFFPWGHTWSLAVEEQFYLIWPWLILLLPKHYLKPFFCIAIFIGLVVGIYTMGFLNNWAGIFLMPTAIQAFGIGGLYAYLKHKNKLTNYSTFFKFLFIFSLIIYYQWSFNHEWQDKYNYFNMLINSIISIGLIHQAIYNKSEKWNKYFFHNKFLNKIGKISYGIYLYHLGMEFTYNGIVNLFTDESTKAGAWLLDWTNAYYFKLVMVYYLSLWSYNYIEKPILMLKTRFEY